VNRLTLLALTKVLRNPALAEGRAEGTEWQWSAGVALFTRLVRRAKAANRLAITMPQVNATGSDIAAVIF